VVSGGGAWGVVVGSCGDGGAGGAGADVCVCVCVRRGVELVESCGFTTLRGLLHKTGHIHCRAGYTWPNALSCWLHVANALSCTVVLARRDQYQQHVSEAGRATDDQ
jgi:hypothetical protein